MNDDAALLRHYAEDGSQAAFAELVRRHIDLVYGAALRRTGGDSHQAADVAQQVFITLARQAPKLSRHAVLCAWLHTATRNAAINLMISEQRRKSRETEAVTLELLTTGDGTTRDWERLRPVLDSAIDELNETDRAAVVLRFLERKPFAQIAAALQLSEDAARRRTERSLDKLRAVLARRGITSTSAALGLIVTSQPLVAAPAGLATTLAAQAVAAVSASGGILGATFIFMNAKIITAGVVSALAGLGLGVYFAWDYNVSQPLPPAPEMPQHTQTIASLRRDNLRLKADVERLTAANLRRPAPSPTPVAPAKNSEPVPTLSIGQQQKAMLNNLRQISAARQQFQLENGRSPASIEELVGEGKYIRRFLPVDGENYAALSMAQGQMLTVSTPNGVTVTYDDAGPNTTKPMLTPAEVQAEEATRRVERAVNKAVDAYRAAHNGAKPRNLEAVIPYFATPQEGADFVEMVEAQKAAGRRP